MDLGQIFAPKISLGESRENCCNSCCIFFERMFTPTRVTTHSPRSKSAVLTLDAQLVQLFEILKLGTVEVFQFLFTPSSK